MIVEIKPPPSFHETSPARHPRAGPSILISPCRLRVEQLRSLPNEMSVEHAGEPPRPGSAGDFLVGINEPSLMVFWPPQSGLPEVFHLVGPPAPWGLSLTSRHFALRDVVQLLAIFVCVSYALIWVCSSPVFAKTGPWLSYPQPYLSSLTNDYVDRPLL